MPDVSTLPRYYEYAITRRQNFGDITLEPGVLLKLRESDDEPATVKIAGRTAHVLTYKALRPMVSMGWVRAVEMVEVGGETNGDPATPPRVDKKPAKRSPRKTR